MTTAHAFQESDVTAPDIVDLVGGLLGGGVGIKMIDAWRGKRKGRTDVLDKLESISGRLAERAEARMRAAEERMDAAESRVQVVEQQLADQRKADEERARLQRVAAIRHTAWDRQVRQSLQALGVDVAPPPPLEVTSVRQEV
ncbi:hypothetical protein [Nocardia niigatensis]